MTDVLLKFKNRIDAEIESQFEWLERESQNASEKMKTETSAAVATLISNVVSLKNRLELLAILRDMLNVDFSDGTRFSSERILTELIQWKNELTVKCIRVTRDGCRSGLVNSTDALSNAIIRHEFSCIAEFIDNSGMLTTAIRLVEEALEQTE